MGTDVKRIMENLLSFYHFRDKVVVSVGAGGGQLIEYGREARKVLAVDNDPHAIETLKDALRKRRLRQRFDLIEGDFGHTSLRGDVVLFEFSLHEMGDPCASIRHARQTASDIVVIDHLPESEWAYYVAEEDKVRRSWDAVLMYDIRKRASFSAAQAFPDYGELYDKVKSQGERSISRAKRFASDRDIIIRMPYGIVLI